jgi:hypothetical protein
MDHDCRYDLVLILFPLKEFSVYWVFTLIFAVVSVYVARRVEGASATEEHASSTSATVNRTEGYGTLSDKQPLML